ncbi:MAG: sigma-70 family RNA polymerase sigma factor [Planctomycetes bacterium]|nr:sigma-70 family RNA polymerase sigma factor [Planctomycetota bacterium]
MDTNDIDTPYLLERAHYHAHRLIGHYGYTHEDSEDIQQDIICHALPRLKNFDSAKSSQHTYISRIVRTSVIDVIRKRHAKKHTALRITPFSDMPEGFIESGTNALLCDEKAESAFEHTDMHDDLKVIYTHLTPLEQKICESLQGKSVHATAQQLGISDYLVNKHITHIRQVMELHGYDGCL